MHFKGHKHVVSHLLQWLVRRSISRESLRFFLLSILLLVPPLNIAFANHYPDRLDFIDMLGDTDIAFGEITVIHQDSEGFIWLGSRNVLARYDGYEFLDVKMTEANGTKKSVSWTRAIHEDRHGNLWIGMENGILKYDRATGELITLPKLIEGESQEAVTSIVQMAPDELVIGAYNGIMVLNIKTLSVRVIVHDPSNPKSIPENPSVLAIEKTGQDTLWIGSQYGVIEADWPKQIYQLHIPNPSKPQSLPQNEVWSMAVDYDGNLWVGVLEGMYHFNTQTKKFKLYQHDPDNDKSLGGNYTVDILVDDKNFVWQGSDKHGLSLYHREQDNFIRFPRIPGVPGTLVQDGVRHIFKDNIGDLWVSSYPSGLNFHDSSMLGLTVNTHIEGNPASLSNNYVASILVEGPGAYWIGTGSGVNRYDRLTKTYTAYTVENGKADSNSIISGYRDNDGDIWFGTWDNGVLLYNPETDRFDQIPYDKTSVGKEFSETDALPAVSIWRFYHCSKNYLWIATHRGGLVRYDKKKKVFKNYRNDPSDPTSISNSMIWAIYEDSKNRLWVGTAWGLNLMDRENETFESYFDESGNPKSLMNSSAQVIFEDSKQRLWVGTNNGLHLFDVEKQEFTHFGVEDGFSDKSIQSIVEDKKGNLWIGTFNGFSRFNYEQRSIKNYSTYLGKKLPKINPGAMVKNNQDQIIMGTTEGWITLDPKLIGQNTTPPPVIFSDFKLFTKSVDIGDYDGVLTKQVNQTERIVLDYTKTMFSFDFAALNYRQSEKNEYAYKLEGFDKNWHYVDDQRKAQYTNLSPGEYAFRVKASNNDGVWNELGKAIKIIQLPPPWRTWWAIGIYIGTALWVIYWVIRYYQKKREFAEEQNRVLELKVAERTQELRQKNYDIQAMLSNMQQGLFAVESDGSIHPEYSVYLESIFETKNIVGRNVLDFLFSPSEISGNKFHQIEVAIDSIVDQKEINYDVNSHLLIREYKITVNGCEKQLSLDWNPIIIDGEVSKLMVVVRDVTDLRKIEQEAKNQKHELTIAGQLINITPSKYVIFENSTLQFLTESYEYIQTLCEGNSEKILDTERDQVLSALFRNMHTIKGNSRTLGFHELSEIVHRVESDYSWLKMSGGILQRERLIEGLDYVKDVLEDYGRVFREVLGREGQDIQNHGDTSIYTSMFHNVRDYIDKICLDNASSPEAVILEPIMKILDAENAQPISILLSDIVASLSPLADQLNKPHPIVTIEAENVYIKEDYHDVMRNVFSHIFRNCIDHGIEAAQEREANDKSPCGEIRLYVTQENEYLNIHVQDDGRGLDIKRLRAKGIDAGQWTEDTCPNPSEIAQLVFMSGVSTKEVVTDISGRGVGMDAVKQFLLQQRGDVKIVLRNLASEEDTPLNGSEDGFMPFETVITLPPNAWIHVT